MSVLTIICSNEHGIYKSLGPNSHNNNAIYVPIYMGFTRIFDQIGSIDVLGHMVLHKFQSQIWESFGCMLDQKQLYPEYDAHTQ